jgi:hypothetical protein
MNSVRLQGQRFSLRAVLGEKIQETRAVVAIKDLFEAIMKRAEAAKAHGIKPRLSKLKTEYYITIPQGYKTRLYKIIIIKGSEGVSIQTYDRGKMEYNEKLPEATLEEVLKWLPLDFLEISGQYGPSEKKNRRPRPRD